MLVQLSFGLFLCPLVLWLPLAATSVTATTTTILFSRGPYPELRGRLRNSSRVAVVLRGFQRSEAENFRQVAAQPTELLGKWPEVATERASQELMPECAAIAHLQVLSRDHRARRIAFVLVYVGQPHHLLLPRDGERESVTADGKIARFWIAHYGGVSVPSDACDCGEVDHLLRQLLQ